MAEKFPGTGVGSAVALVLAGGRGSRLAPLTDSRPKPDVPLGGIYRLIDVVLSNLAHSGFRDVWIVEQYLPFALNQHLAGGRPWDLDGTRHGLRILPPGQGSAGAGFAEGNGQALYQQLPLLQSFGADAVLVTSADHLYQMDFAPVLEQHRRLGSDLTVVTTELDQDVSRYGVVRTDADHRVTEYRYKPEDPVGHLVATEVFVFDVAALARAAQALRTSEDDHGSSLGDYGETIVPWLVEHADVHDYRLEGYWRDLGTIDAYFRAHMDLLEGTGLDLDRPDWPIVPHPGMQSPARFGPRAAVSGSMVSPGARVNGAVESSVIGPGVLVEEGATVRRSVLLGEAVVPAGAVLESVVADVGARIPRGRTGRTKPGPGNITVLESGSGQHTVDAQETPGKGHS